MCHNPRMLSIRLAMIASLLLFAACGKSDWPSEEERTLEQGHAPTPYTAAQIRDGCPSGRVCTFRIESDGGFSIVKRYRYLEADDQGVTIEASLEGSGPGGNQAPSKSRSNWRELQRHASFPADSTKISDQEVQTPAGTFQCMRYVVTTEEGGKTVVKYLDFARELPGMPVRMTLEYDGKQISTKTLISHGAE